MSIQEHLNKIRNAVYGREVRESIAKGIETAYDDASENGNANMEVKIARGTNPNLNTRLNKMEETDRQTTAQLAQTTDELSKVPSKINNAVSPKADKTYVDSQIQSVASGAPRIVANTSGELITNYPNGSDDNAFVLSDGCIYYWNGTAWENTGIEYQSAVKKGTGEVKYIGSAPVDISYPGREITFPSYAAGVSQLIINGVAYSISPETAKVIIPSEISNGKLLFNVNTHEFRIANTTEPLNVNEYTVMVFRLLEENVSINGRYSWNDLERSGLTDEELQSYIKGTGGVLYIGSSPVNVTYPGREITFPGTAHLIVNSKTFSVSNNIVSIPENIFNGVLIFNSRSENFKVKSFAYVLEPHDHVVMAFRLLEKIVELNGSHSWNGINQKGITNNDIKGVGEIKIVSNGYTDVDTSLREVVFPSFTGERTFIFVNGKGYELNSSNSKVSFPHAEVGGVVKIGFNTVTEKMTARRWAQELSENEVIIMVINSLANPFDVSMNGRFTIDGELGSALEMQKLRDDLSLSVITHNVEDSIYSWWTSPIAVRHVGHRDKTYLGYTDSQGYTGAASINNETGQETKKRLKKRDIDDHNASAVEIMGDGRVMAVYSSGHNQDNFLTIRISSKIESIEEFDEEVEILANGTTTYAQILKKNEKYFVFFRTGNRNWSYVESSNGTEWSEPIEFLNGGMQYYCKVVDTNDVNLLRIVMYSNPNETDYNMRLGFFDTLTSEFKLQDGTVVGVEGISKDAFPIILPIEEGKKQRLLDVAITDVDTTIIAYATFTDYVTARTDWQDVIYKVANHHQINGLNTTTLTYGGKPFYYFSVYVGGTVFGYDENTLFMSRQDENDIWHIEKWETADQLTWAMSESINQAKEGSVAIRPVIEKDGDKVIWQEGFYNPTSFSDNNVDYKYKKVRNLM